MISSRGFQARPTNPVSMEEALGGVSEKKSLIEVEPGTQIQDLTGVPEEHVKERYSLFELRIIRK